MCGLFRFSFYRIRAIIAITNICFESRRVSTDSKFRENQYIVIAKCNFCAKRVFSFMVVLSPEKRSKIMKAIHSNNISIFEHAILESEDKNGLENPLFERKAV